MSKKPPIIIAAYITGAASIIAAIIIVGFPYVFRKSDKSTSVHESTEVSPDSVRVLSEYVGKTAQLDENKEQIISTSEVSEVIKSESFSPITLDQFHKTCLDDSLTDLQKDDFVKKQMNRHFIWEGLIETIEEGSHGKITLTIESKANDWYIAICTFGKEHRQDLLSLKPKQHIMLTGILRYFAGIPSLDECKLLKILD